MEDKAQSLLLTNVIIKAFFSPTEQFCLHWDPHSHWQDHGLRLNLTLGWNSNDCNCFLFLSLWSLHQRVVRKWCVYVVEKEVMITWTCGWLGGILCRVLAVVIHADIPVCEMISSVARSARAKCCCGTARSSLALGCRRRVSAAAAAAALACWSPANRREEVVNVGWGRFLWMISCKGLGTHQQVLLLTLTVLIGGVQHLEGRHQCGGAGCGGTQHKHRFEKNYRTLWR